MSIKTKKHIESFILTFITGVLGTLAVLLPDVPGDLSQDLILSIGVGSFFGGIRAVVKLLNEELLTKK